MGVFITPYLAAQRTNIPELFGDDETLVAKASGLFGAVTQLPIVIGPALAGVLIASIGTVSLLVIDAVTFLFAFVVVVLLVRGGSRVPQDGESRGVLAGVRYLTRDRLLGPMSADPDPDRWFRKRDFRRHAAARVHGYDQNARRRRIFWGLASARSPGPCWW